ncbi:MAG: phage tail fiber protein [Marinobacter sp. T13-3]|nr:MAG: phage tail fiber protein [Marinobacter sp. T13-3]
MRIIETDTGRALEHNGQTVDLPALPVDAVVHGYDTPQGLWADVQEAGKPRPVYAGSDGVKLGEIELPADPVAVRQAEAEGLKARFEKAVQNHMDATATERNYDGILSLCTYATSSVTKFAAEGQAGVEWRDQVWAKCYQILSDVEAGSRSAPTEPELISELPVFEWPAA